MTKDAPQLIKKGTNHDEGMDQGLTEVLPNLKSKNVVL